MLEMVKDKIIYIKGDQLKFYKIIPCSVINIQDLYLEKIYNF